MSSDASGDTNETPDKRKTRQHYSKDVRELVIYQKEKLDMSAADISVSLNMPISVVYRTLQLHREIGNVVKDPASYAKRGRPRLLDEDTCNYIVRLLDLKPDLYLDELAFELSETLQITPAISTIHYTLKQLGYTSKKLSKIAQERCELRRRDYLFDISQEPADYLVFTDESAVNLLTSYRSMGRALKGRRARMRTYFQRGNRFSVLPALALDGILHLHITNGSINGDSFQAFLSELLPLMNPYPGRNSVLVMDNCAIHHIDVVHELCDERGVRLVYLPPYSPDLNPIEECFSYMKSVLRRHGDTFRQVIESKDEVAIKAFISDTLATVTERHVKGWFRHSNYL